MTEQPPFRYSDLLPTGRTAGGCCDPAYELLFMAKGGGSANKSFLYQV